MGEKVLSTGTGTHSKKYTGWGEYRPSLLMYPSDIKSDKSDMKL